MGKLLPNFLGLGLSLLLFVAIIYLQQPPTKADLSSTQCANVPADTSTKISGGLVTSNQWVDSGIVGRFKTEYGCAIGPEAAVILQDAEINLSTYEDIKIRYYNQYADQSKKATGLPTSISAGHLYYISGNGTTTIDSSVNTNFRQGSGAALIIIDGNLSITSNLTYGENPDGSSNPNSGLVFIVGGNIWIDPNVEKINGVFISTGEICTNYTAGLGTPCRSNYPPSPDKKLTVKGSFISLTAESAAARPSLNLIRNLKGDGATSNSEPAETITLDPKYFVLLKDIFSTTLQYTNEINN